MNPTRLRAPSRRRAATLTALLLGSMFLIAPDRARAPEPGDNIGVSTGPSGALGASLAVDDAGDLHLAWREDLAGQWGAYYSGSTDGTTWSAPLRVDGPGGNVHTVSLAVEREAVPSRGRLYVAYEREDDIWLVTSPDGVTWSLPSRVDAAPWGEKSLDPYVAASNGRVWVAWVDFRVGSQPRIYLRSSTDAGASWGPEIALSGADMPGLEPVVEAKADTVVVAWEVYMPPAIGSARSEDGGATWRLSLAAQADKSYESLYDPDLFLDDLGVAHVVWAHRGYVPWGFDWRLWSRVSYAWSSDGVSWSAPARVDDATDLDVFARSPSIGGLGGTLWVAYADNRTGDYDVHASWSFDGVRWGDGSMNENDLRVDDTDRNANPADDASKQTEPVLRTGGYGVYLAWEDYRSGPVGDLYFSALRASPLVITEIQDEPASEARVEIYNAARTPYSLGLVLLYAGTSLVNLGALGSAPPRSHLVIGAAAGSDLQVPLNLGTEGAPVYLVRQLEILAFVGSGTYGPAPDPLPGESTGRYAGTLDYAGAWTRSPTPSFRARNAVTPPNLNPEIVLNELLYHAIAPADRFADLYFRGSGTRDLVGYRLVGDVVFTMPSATVRDASRHALVAAVQASSLFDSLGAGGDNLYLYDAQGRLLDMVGWTSAHTQGRSVARADEGVGGTRAYDDSSAVANGWLFDRVPTPRFLELGPPATLFADLGSAVEFDLVAWSHAPSADYVNVRLGSAPPGWSVSFLRSDRTPLTDSPGDADGTPDLGLVAPGASASFFAVVSVPPAGPETGGTLTVEAAFSIYPWQADVTLRVGIHPFVEVGRRVQPTTVYVAGSPPPYWDNATVTISARGAGSPIPVLTPLDVIFEIPISASMGSSDPTNLRINATKAYIDRMRPVDRGSLIGFHNQSYVVLNRILEYATTIGKGRLKSDADSLACSPFCDIPMTDEDLMQDYTAAIELGNDWLLRYGDPANDRVQILLADGPCDPPCTGLPPFLFEAVANRITIHTVGLGPAADGPLLESIATATGGAYRHADAPEDLLAIYEALALRLNYSAATDPNLADAVSLVEDALPLYIAPRAGTFLDPTTGQPRNPTAIVPLADRTLVRWNLGRIAVGTTWSVQFDVTSSQTGLVDVALYPDARLAYNGWDGGPVIQPIPGATLFVLPAPDPPFITDTFPRQGDFDIPTDTMLAVSFSEAMDASTVRWTIDPPVPLVPWWPLSNTLVLNHTAVRECTTYTMEITDAQDIEGEFLRPAVVPNPWLFATVCIRPFVQDTSPVHGIADVPLDAPIVVTFSEPMDSAATTATTNPPMAFSHQWDGTGAVLTLTHSDSFLECTTYTVTAVGRDPDGGGLTGGPVPNPWSFATACPPRVRYTITRLPAVGTVLVDNDPYPVPYTFSWKPGDVHRIAASEFEPPGPSRLAFLSWSDGGARIHDVTVGDADQTITAAYVLQHPVSLTLTGLVPTWPAAVAYEALGAPASASTYDSWSAWADDGSAVSVDQVVTGPTGELWATVDAVQWIVTAPLDPEVAYRHQFWAEVRGVGLDAQGADITFMAWGIEVLGRAEPSWSAWVDAGTQVSAPGIVDVGPRERYRTRDATEWTADGPIDAVVSYRHQFSPHVRLGGTDADHSVGASSTLDGAEARAASLFGEWTGWADAGSVLAFDAETSGIPRFRAAGPTSFPVSDAFDASIQYVAPSGPRPPVPVENGKPLLSMVYALALGVAASFVARRVQRSGWTVARTRLALLVVGSPAAAEAAVGLASLGTGLLRIPEAGTWLSAGFWADTAILAAGLAAITIVFRMLPTPPERREDPEAATDSAE